MNIATTHAEWLSLIDISGPFLAEPVLKDVFPQGLEDLEVPKRRMLRQAYDEWREAQELDDEELRAIHAAWIDLVLRQGLELDEDGAGDVFKAQRDLKNTVCAEIPERGVVLRPDYAVVNDQKDDEPMLLVSVYDPGVALDEPFKTDGWPASPAERMVEMCRAIGVRLGLVTNGERWMLVDAPVGAVTSFASWYANLWSPEPKTLQAFVNLLGVRRFFVDRSEQLPALLDESLKLQDEVTDALGEQVRRAVEVLIQRLDRADLDLNRTLLTDVTPAEIYESALTVMMRIVFLLSAEERGLLLMGDERYEANYAISTLRMQLRGEAEEILERRQDAWSRLLAIFRAVYGGIEHEALRMPALGGSLFDPDRFPFLEGRSKGSNWKADPAKPLPIDNRTVLLLLDAVQLFQGRTLSYRALDVEQIGYVYEGLLERTVVRAKDVTLDLDATKSAKKPWVTLDELEAADAKGGDAVSALLKERTGSSASRITNDLAKQVEESDADKLLTACHGDQALRDSIKPYFHFLRIDRWGYPLVYPVGTFMVTTGEDRRETGTHYTPKSLTEAIVKETLEPIVYVGPAEGKPREDWKLKSPTELLDLKICDPAMGSGAFLVQVCRWLSERLVEAWERSEEAGNEVTSEGVVVAGPNGHEPLRRDPEERLLTARRLIAERCLYGVDVNPLAVELAKLSIWLVTLSKGRPFGFLDHNLRSGDSLLGIHDLNQLLCLEMAPTKNSAKKLFATGIDKAVSEAVALRAELRGRPILDIRDIEAMAELDGEARDRLQLPELIADALAADVLAAGGRKIDTTSLSIDAGKAIAGDTDATGLLKRRAIVGLGTDLPAGRNIRRPFHWPLEFPEVFQQENGGFDGIVGNPPFLGGHRITGHHGVSYRNFLIERIANGVRGTADLSSYFFLRAHQILKSQGCMGLLAVNTISEGDTRQVGLEPMLASGATIFRANPNETWPGKAAVVTTRVNIYKGKWNGRCVLSERPVPTISPFLSEMVEVTPERLNENLNRAFNGCTVLGLGFTITEEQAQEFLNLDRRNAEVVFPYLNGRDLNTRPDQDASRWIINFWDWPEQRAAEFSEPFKVVEEKVKPQRQERKANGEYKQRRPLPQKWWQYADRRPALFHAIGRGRYFQNHPDGWCSNEAQPKHVLVKAQTSSTFSFAFVPNNMVFDQKLIVFSNVSWKEFAVLQSDVHLVWAVHHGSTLKNDFVYTPTDCFVTFPFPDISQLEEVGEEFHRLRGEVMSKNGIGLTKMDKMFHDPKRNEEDLLKIRRVFTEMNEAIVQAYGWNDIDLEQGFHQVPYRPEGQNIRFTINENARQAVLSRLASLNKARHEAQGRSNSTMRERPVKSKSAEGALDDLFSAQGGRQ